MSEVYVDKNGIAHDDEGHSWKAPGFAKGVYSGTHISPRSKLNVKRKRPEINREKLDALYLALYYEPKNRILSYAARALSKGGEVNAKEAKQIRDIMKKNGMKKEAKLFEDVGNVMSRMIGMSNILSRIEEKADDLFAKELETKSGNPEEEKKLKEVEAKLGEVEKKAVSMEKMFTSDGMKKVNSNMAFKKAMKNRSVVFKKLTGDWSASAMTKKRQSEVDAYQAYIDAMNKVADEYKDEALSLRKVYLRR